MMVVIENQNVDTHLEVIFDASESVNLSTTRGSLLTQDTIPPMSRSVCNKVTVGGDIYLNEGCSLISANPFLQNSREENL